MAASVFIWPGLFSSDGSGNVIFSGNGLFPNGTVAAPSIAFASEPSLGLFRAGAGLLDFSGTLLGVTPLGGLGYGVGAGGVVTQITSRTTGVTLNTVTGDITLVSAAGSAIAASFTVTNSVVALNDNVIINEKSGVDLYQIFITNVVAGSFRVTFFTTGGVTVEQPVFHFSVVKGAIA